MNYTRDDLDNSSVNPKSPQTADRLLFCIKTRGPIATADLASIFGMTVEAARQQVQKLVAAGLIEGEQDAAPGVGRPRQNWVLTEAGNARFPDTHAQLSAQLIDSVRKLFGEDGLERLVNERGAEARTLYQNTCDANDLTERLRQLASIRSAEGYMARLERDGDDWLLIEDHCPICIAARSCQGFCRSELQLFQEIVGEGAEVIREQHLLAGARRCVYRVIMREGSAGPKH